MARYTANDIVEIMSSRTLASEADCSWDRIKAILHEVDDEDEIKALLDYVWRHFFTIVMGWRDPESAVAVVFGMGVALGRELEIRGS